MKYLIGMTNKADGSRKSILVLANDMDSAFAAADKHYPDHKATSGTLLYPHSPMHLLSDEEHLELVDAL